MAPGIQTASAASGFRWALASSASWDAFDAIIHERPYRPARSVEEAVAELQREAGAQFDPDLVRLFLPIVEQEHAEIRTPAIRALEALRAAL